MDLADPRWLLARVDPDAARFHFAWVPREVLHASAFLDHRIAERPQRTYSAGLDEVQAVADAIPEQATGWIIHTAFCCSTLLARALDEPGRTLVLREPLALTGLADRARSAPAGADSIVRTALRLMERQQGDATVVIKPTNYANALVPALAAASHRRLVFLSGSLTAFLLSVAKKREEAEQRLLNFLHAALQDSDYLAAADYGGPLPGDVLKQAAMLWHAQRHALQAHIRDLGSRVMLLDVDTLLDKPQETLGAVAAHIGLDLSDGHLQRAVGGAVFGRDAKDGATPFTSEDRRRADRSVALEHEETLRSALAWVAPLLQRAPIRPFPGERPDAGAPLG